MKPIKTIELRRALVYILLSIISNCIISRAEESTFEVGGGTYANNFTDYTPKTPPTAITCGSLISADWTVLEKQQLRTLYTGLYPWAVYHNEASRWMNCHNVAFSTMHVNRWMVYPAANWLDGSYTFVYSGYNWLSPTLYNNWHFFGWNNDHLRITWVTGNVNVPIHSMVVEDIVDFGNGHFSAWGMSKWGNGCSWSHYSHGGHTPYPPGAANLNPLLYVYRRPS